MTGLRAADVFGPARSLNWLRANGQGLLWIEGRPAEARAALVSWQPGTAPQTLTAEGQSCSNQVGYGGIPFAVSPQGVVLACNAEDQRIYELETGAPVTPPSPDKAARWADFVVTDQHLFAVREQHLGDGRITNELVRVSRAAHTCVTLDGGHDFVGSPVLSPDGTRLAWISWDFPQMPWDGAELWVADITAKGIANKMRVAGSTTESVVEPTWTPDGELLFFSDRSGWWNLYRDGSDEPVVAMTADMCDPLWMLGNRSVDVFADGRLLVRWFDHGTEHLAVRTADGELHEVATPYSVFRSVNAVGDKVAAIVASPQHAPRVVVLDPVQGGEGLVVCDNGVVAPDVVSVPEAIEFPTTDGAVAHAFFYAPTSPTDGPVPLIVNGHGGPTSHVVPQLDLRQQFWTSRGYGYVELNHRGSTGYGRAYRDALQGRWGVVDVDDAVAVTQYLVDKGLADPAKLFIRGLSAGGWLTLAALAFSDTFAAGASMNGVSDPHKMALDTHKFESRYMDYLIGPMDDEALYDERAPIHHADRINAPLLLLQGEVDNVVPVDQAQRIAEVLRARGVEHELIVYEGEGHLFGKAENLVHALEAEAAFFEKVMSQR